ncbi:MAG: hypothetical protein ACLQIB_01665, partial [Isosphaeraceae bacterium]
MSIVEAQDPIQVTANSGARSRLDKRGGAARHVENHLNWGKRVPSSFVAHRELFAAVKDVF